MSGTIQRVLSKETFDNSGLAASAVSIITIARKVDGSRMRDAIITFRLHSATWSGGAKVELLTGPDGYTDEDPAAEWNAPMSSQITFTQGRTRTRQCDM